MKKIDQNNTMKNFLRKYKKAYMVVFQVSVFSCILSLIVVPLTLKGEFEWLDSVHKPLALISLGLFLVCFFLPFFVFRKERLASGRKI